ncbi:conserved Plasmodium protein, unknown function [Plasmodium berghei]|uniref:Uncharacterized protein n=2 Tax=Plasmodium berghei TaxID=5821 RepID=A0A509AJT2_PLABA|nr:conserved Plasmodium protein, unknown function [Plasmodium berghei ANKA]CXI52346.1 conserved Plasmodium protein, unknown function [Plasmodium berghei]SCL94606.1 conserved Plasmodium protein, unknown function [Plasmodium berghei]SCM16064.1 conserved Plasmodium protein, unknown function [Plasmodium berghei]SCM17859.1 conserved Plasmodium protein, unknown function [Plasmodium berghei]SCN26159.1 conserved Plasmodium protein, unknown function [Plasmodium berghei]|eukprot:XP_034421988.1 conserved Plasmodium protein, unknown function [Plasmodium berghei ANKA]
MESNIYGNKNSNNNCDIHQKNEKENDSIKQVSDLNTLDSLEKKIETKKNKSDKNLMYSEYKENLSQNIPKNNNSDNMNQDINKIDSIVSNKGKNKEITNDLEKEQNEETDDICVKRIINVEITTKIKDFLENFAQEKEKILKWCNENKSLYSNKINEKTLNIFFDESENINNIILKGNNINLDILNLLLYFYNLYCTNINKEKVNAHEIMENSSITYRGIYENINKNSTSFKNLLKEEKKYKKLIGEATQINEFFSNYKKTIPYGINIIIGIFLTFLSGYYGSLLVGITKFTTRLICGIVFSYITLIIEVIIFIVINEKMSKLKKGQKRLSSNYSLYKKLYFPKNVNDKGKIQKLKQVDKQIAVKQRKKI